MRPLGMPLIFAVGVCLRVQACFAADTPVLTLADPPGIMMLGTLPTNSFPVGDLQFTSFAVTNTTAYLSFLSAYPQHPYTIDTCVNLGAGNWTTLTNGVVGYSVNANLLAATNRPRQFYRVVVGDDHDETVLTLSRIATALDGYYAKYGQFPPVPVYTNASGSAYQPFGYEYPDRLGMNFRAFNILMATGDAWNSGPVFTFGLLSFLLPRYTGSADNIAGAWDPLFGLDQWCQYNASVGDQPGDWAAELSWAASLEGLEYRFFQPRITMVDSAIYTNWYETICDGWGHELVYTSSPPYQAYTLYSTGTNASLSCWSDDIPVSKTNCFPSFASGLSARDAVVTGLVAAINGIGAFPPPWHTVWGVSNGTRIVVFQPETIQSYDEGVGTDAGVNPADVVTAEALQYVPAALRSNVQSAAPEWIVQGVNGNPSTRYAYVAVDVSGQLDANYVLRTNRWLGSTPGEIQAGPASTYDIISTAAFVTARTTQLRYNTMEELRAINPGVSDPLLTHFGAFSYAPIDLAPDGQPKLYIGGDVGSRLSDATFSNRLRQILSYPNMLGYHDSNHDVVGNSTNTEIQARVSNFICSLADYTSSNNFPAGFGYPKVKPLPMIQSVFWSPHVVYTNYLSGANKVHCFSSADTFYVVVYCPNIQDATTGAFYAKLKLSSDAEPWLAISTDSQIALCCKQVMLPSTDSAYVQTTNALVYSSSAGYVVLAASTSPPPQSVTRPTSSVVNTGSGTYNAVVKISLFRASDGREIDRVPADFTAQSGVHLYCTNFNYSPKGFTNWPTGFKCWSEVLDPRFNWDPRDNNFLPPGLSSGTQIPQWIADNSLRTCTSQTVWPGLTNPPWPGQGANGVQLYDYFGPDGGGTFMNRVLTNALLIKDSVAMTGALPFLFDNMGKRGAGGTAWTDSRVSGTDWHNNQRMYSANRSLLSVGELGYIPISFWSTLRLYGHNDQYSFQTPDIGNGKHYHPVYDYFTLTPTNPVPRGLVSVNTPFPGALCAVVTNMPLREWQTNNPCVLSDKVANVVSAITDMTSTNPFTSVDDLGKIAWYSKDFGATNEFDREAVIRNSAGLLTTRQQIYTVILRADSLSRQFGYTDLRHANVMASAYAVANLWRDPVPNSQGGHAVLLDSFVWLSDLANCQPGTSVVSRIAAEARNAKLDSVLQGWIGGDEMMFWALSSSGTDNVHAARCVDYYLYGSLLMRDEYACSTNGWDGANRQLSSSEVAASNVVCFTISNPEPGTGVTNLPAWVDLRCDFSQPSCTVTQRVYFVQKQLVTGP